MLARTKSYGISFPPTSHHGVALNPKQILLKGNRVHRVGFCRSIASADRNLEEGRIHFGATFGTDDDPNDEAVAGPTGVASANL